MSATCFSLLSQKDLPGALRYFPGIADLCAEKWLRAVEMVLGLYKQLFAQLRAKLYVHPLWCELAVLSEGPIYDQVNPLARFAAMAQPPATLTPEQQGRLYALLRDFLFALSELDDDFVPQALSLLRAMLPYEDVVSAVLDLKLTTRIGPRCYPATELIQGLPDYGIPVAARYCEKRGISIELKIVSNVDDGTFVLYYPPQPPQRGAVPHRIDLATLIDHCRYCSRRVDVRAILNADGECWLIG